MPLFPGADTQDRISPKDMDEVVKLTKDYKTFRIVGDVQTRFQFFIKFINREGKERGFYKYCSDWDSDKMDFVRDKCPWREHELGQGSIRYLVNVIDREAVEHIPARLPHPTENEQKKRRYKDGISYYRKDIRSATWTPIKILIVPKTVAGTLNALSQLNRHKGKEYDVAHIKYGKDVSISYDKDKEGTSMYDVQVGEKTPLSKEERKYLHHNLSKYLLPDPLEVDMKECKEFMKRNKKQELDTLATRAKAAKTRNESEYENDSSAEE